MSRIHARAAALGLGLTLCACSGAHAGSTTSGSGGTSSGSGATSVTSGSGASATATGSTGSSATSSSTATSSSSSSSSSSGSTGSTGAPLLRFAFTGDTRPGSADDVANYPTQVVQQIVASMSTKDVAFALDTGDHVKIGKSDTVSDAQRYANQMMQLYTGATGALGKPWYLTMGNHECWDNKNLCDNSDAVLQIFMGYVQQQLGTVEPYYTFDVQTPRGVATFVFVADTAWDATEATWLESALSHGDGSAYTIVAKHVPSTNTSDFSTNADEMAIIEAHKFALLVDSHAHLYSHSGEGGREVTLGLGGAPLANQAVDSYGYGLVEQQADGTLKVTEYDAALDAPKDSFVVGPNP